MDSFAFDARFYIVVKDLVVVETMGVESLHFM